MENESGANTNKPVDARLLDPEELRQRENYFRDELGFSQQHLDSLKQCRPHLYSIDTIQKHVSGLQERGFGNPNKMIENLPAILGYSFENIDSKIKGLQERGFGNPNKMIESFPTILGLSFENIDSKLRLLDLLNNTYKLNLNPIEAIESNLTILGTKFEKLIVIARILREYSPSVEDIQRKISALYTINLESLLLSYSQKKPSDSIDDLIRNTRNIQKEKMTKEYKRDLIKDFFSQNPESYKIYRDYLKGYPEKIKNFSPVE